MRCRCFYPITLIVSRLRPEPPERSEADEARSSALAAVLFVNARDALAALEFGGDVVRREAGGGPQHQQVVEHIGAFAGERGAVVVHRLDDGFERLLAEFTSDADRAEGEQLRGVGAVRTGAAPRLYSRPQSAQGLAERLLHWALLSSLPRRRESRGDRSVAGPGFPLSRE